MDFGMSVMKCEEEEQFSEKVGTLNWTAPELICGQKYGEKADIFSLGVFAIELAEGNPPWIDEQEKQIRLNICGKDLPKINPKWPPAF